MTAPRDTTIDRERLRLERLARCLDAMERHRLDALVLGREANARYVSGAGRLWLAGTRPFGPGCVVLRATGEVHLLSTTEVGIPDALPRANLYALTWNPDVLAQRLAAIPGLREARRVGVDGWNAAAGRLLASVTPQAEVVDASPALAAARRRKTADEVQCIRAAVTMTRRALGAVAAALVPGVDEGTLRGVFAQQAATEGATIPAVEATLRVTSDARAGAGRAPAAGDLVTIRGGVLLAGYDGTVARTVACPPVEASVLQALLARADRLFARLASACQPGATASDLLSAHADSGEVLPRCPIAYGVGLGAEPPLIGAAHTCDAGFALEPGMVLALSAYVGGDAGFVRQETIHVRDAGYEILG